MTQTLPLLVGSYTESYATFRAVGEGLSLLGFDPASGRLTARATLRGLPNPSYVRWLTPRHAHVLMETADARAGIACIDIADRIALVAQTSIAGQAPCHVDVHPDGSWLAVACYGSGHVARVDGALTRAETLFRQTGSSTHPQRQTESHPHAACFSRDGRFLIIPDLGTDELWVYPMPGAAPRRWRVPSGGGPRLILFSHDQRHLILVHELSSAVSSLRWREGEIESVATLSTLPPGFAGANTAAGLRWHPSGALFAVSNRGENSIALFRFDAASGAIALAAHHASGGVKPRDFEFSPCGRWLIVGNQDGDSLVVLAVDPERATLADSGERARIGSPSCVRFQPS